MRAHWLDRLFGVLMSRPRIFADGWGQQEVLRRVREDEAPFAARPRLDIQWKNAREVDGLFQRAGTYLSPDATTMMPPEVQTGHVLWLGPAGETQEDLPAWVVLAASGEEGFARRRQLMAPLVRQGCGALLVENPYYGLRRPKGQRGAKIRTVADQFIMNASTIREGLGLLDGLRRAGHPKVGITGYSMGGHMAAYAACHDGGRLAVVPAATGLSAEPIYTEGALSRSVAWPRLGGAPTAELELGALLRRITEALPPLSADNPAILVAARHDGFVFPEQVERLHALWPHSELRWVDGGHVTALVRRSDVIRDAMRDAMAQLREP